MDQRIFIAQLNTEHYRWRLDGDLDDDQRRLVERLLADEEARLSSLRVSVSEDMLSGLLNSVGSWAGDLLDGGHERQQHPLAAELSRVLNEVPCAMSLVHSRGDIMLANASMRRFVTERMPSRDAQAVRRWRLLGADGEALDPTLWPGARALRGDVVTPGLDAFHVDEAGQETALRIAAVPVRGSDRSVVGTIGAVYELTALAHPQVQDLLEGLLAEEQSRSRRLAAHGRKR